ncbi:PfkB family carbohydrate kinase [Microbacterium keratanolyticum]
MSDHHPATPETRRALVIGEAFVDLIAQTTPAASVFVPKFGGSPLNVAVGVRRLGTPVQLAATLAPGTFGAALKDFCASEDVDIDALSTPVTHTFLTVATPREGHVQYEYFGDLSSLTAIEAVDDEIAKTAAVVHASSTVFLANPARATAVRAFRAAQGFRSMDPNPRPNLIDDREEYLRQIKAAYAEVDLLKVSDEDLDYLMPGTTAEDAALALHGEHHITVIVTRAASPTLLAYGGGITEITVPPTTVVDATGAGDSFMASVLADVAQYGQPLAVDMWVEYIRRANSAASATCQGTGGAESMPTATQLNRSNPRVLRAQEG